MEKHAVSVLLPLALPEPFDYLADKALPPGSFVRVPVRNKEEVGVVWGEGTLLSGTDKKIKEVREVLPLPPLPEKSREFAEWAADYTVTPKGAVLKMFMGAPGAFSARAKPGKWQEPVFAKVDLNEAQEKAARGISESLGRFGVTVLDGVTGSGKTEVYFEAIQKALETGGQVLVLLPEIGLSVQWLERFSRRFGARPGIWHSDATAKERREAWLGALSGDLRLVVGARSALFLPFSNLSLIVVDEEHDASYKQEEGVVYHGRDMAVARARIENIPVVLVSATPSLETVVNVERGKYSLCHLPSRFGGAKLPKVVVVDMKKEKLASGTFLSSRLKEALLQTVNAGRQALLFLNRRGYAPLTLCRKCGFRFQCPHCSAWMVRHKASAVRDAYLQCHHCGYNIDMPDSCPSCGAEESLHPCGPGAERIAEEARALLPLARVEIVTSDTVATAKAAEEAISRMGRHEVDVLVGTQMIAKGHHFPALDLVGVVDADLGLAGGDLRGMERTYQLLHQVAGRAGREGESGVVFLQTYLPDNPVIKALAGEGRDGFLEVEAETRKEFSMPPFGRLASIMISGKNEDAARRAVFAFSEIAPKSADITVLGPAPAPLYMLRGNYRFRLLLKTERGKSLQKYIRAWLSGFKLPSGVRMKVDIDPYNFV